MISDHETHITKFANNHEFTRDLDRDLSFKTTLQE